MYSQSIGNLKNITTPKDFALCSFLFSPKSSFTAIPGFFTVMKSPSEADAVQLADFAFTAGGAWYSFTDLTEGADFIEEQKQSAAGIYFDVKMEFLLNGDDYTERGKRLRAMFRDEMIVVAKQANGAWRLIGSLERGADFIYQYERQLNKCAFTWQSQNPCLYINVS